MLARIIIIAKYCDALPLYCQEKILARYGGSITRTTMANWLIRLSLQLFEGFSGYLQTDGYAGYSAGASAFFYSLIESAKANGLEPFEYLNRILKELP